MRFSLNSLAGQMTVDAKTVLLLAIACLASPVWAIQKCVQPDGKVVFQDTECSSGKGQTINVRPSTGAGNPAPSPTKPEIKATAEAQPTPPPPPSAPVQPSVAAKTPLEQEADLCLNWYKELLRDPQGAYYTNPKKEKRVLSMDLHSTNGLGGYVVKTAACEIHTGKLNHAWTKNHAKWGGWGVN